MILQPNPPLKVAQFLLLYAGAGALLFFAFFRENNILSVDVYYHFVVTERILADGLWTDITWLPFTVLGEQGTDHHWLSHLLITPFALLLRDAGLVSLPQRHALVAVLVVLSLVGFYRGLELWQQKPKSQILGSSPFTEQIKRHVPKNTLLINNEWSNFQQLVWLLPDYRFANGLDGNYLLYGSPRKFLLWRQLSGVEPPQGADYFQLLRQAFDSPWLLIQKSATQNPGALAAAHEAADATLMIENTSLALFYIAELTPDATAQEQVPP